MADRLEILFLLLNHTFPSSLMTHSSRLSTHLTMITFHRFFKHSLNFGLLSIDQKYVNRVFFHGKTGKE